MMTYKISIAATLFCSDLPHNKTSSFCVQYTIPKISSMVAYENPKSQ